MKLEHFLASYTKINSKWIENLTRNYKTLGGKLRTLSKINHSKIPYNTHPKVSEIKTKTNNGT